MVMSRLARFHFLLCILLQKMSLYYLYWIIMLNERIQEMLPTDYDISVFNSAGR